MIEKSREKRSRKSVGKNNKVTTYPFTIYLQLIGIIMVGADCPVTRIREGIRLKKRIMIILMLSLVLLTLPACGGSEKDVSDRTSEQGEEKGELLSQFAEDDGATWKESWEEKTADGDSIVVEIAASIVIPRIPRMSTVEVRKYDFNSENKKKVAEAVLGDEIYYGDIDKLPRSELEKLLEQEREALQESNESWQEILEEGNLYESADYETYKASVKKDLEDQKSRVEKYEEMVRKAPDEYVTIRENDFQGERYIGKRDDIQYCLDFSDHSINFSPLEQEDVYPDRAKGFDGYVSYRFGEQEGLKNECNRQKKEAEELARDFMQKMGFAELVLKEAKDLVWDLSRKGNPGGNECFADGWKFSFAAGADGVAFDSFGTEGDSVYRVGNEEYPAKKNYPLGCSMEIYVTDRGVIEAGYYSPIEIQSVTPGVKLLPLKDIKEIVRSSMGEYAQFYIDKGKKLVGAIRFTYMELVYYRLDDPDDKNKFTYIPAWRLRRSGDQQLYYIVNAIDGSVIRDWESTWSLSENWVL